MARAVWWYVRHLVPLVGGLIDARAYRYLADSIADFAAPADTTRALAAAGFADTATRSFAGGAVVLFEAQKR
jgi:ubiquinone/menaquinone biosynthesis C-methylase UbiE